MSDAFFNEQRGHTRYKTNKDFIDSTWCFCKKGVFSKIINMHYPAYVLNISKGGLAFLSDTEIEIDNQISVTVAYKDYRPLMLDGRVRHCTKFENKSKHKSDKEYYRVGIQFGYNDSEAISEYLRLLKRLGATDLDD